MNCFFFLFIPPLDIQVILNAETKWVAPTQFRAMQKNNLRVFQENIISQKLNQIGQIVIDQVHEKHLG